MHVGRQNNELAREALGVFSGGERRAVAYEQHERGGDHVAVVQGLGRDDEQGAQRVEQDERPEERQHERSRPAGLRQVLEAQDLASRQREVHDEQREEAQRRPGESHQGQRDDGGYRTCREYGEPHTGAHGHAVPAGRNQQHAKQCREEQRPPRAAKQRRVGGICLREARAVRRLVEPHPHDGVEQGRPSDDFPLWVELFHMQVEAQGAHAVAPPAIVGRRFPCTWSRKPSKLTLPATVLPPARWLNHPKGMSLSAAYRRVRKRRFCGAFSYCESRAPHSMYGDKEGRTSCKRELSAGIF